MSCPNLKPSCAVLTRLCVGKYGTPVCEDCAEFEVSVVYSQSHMSNDSNTQDKLTMSSTCCLLSPSFGWPWEDPWNACLSLSLFMWVALSPLTCHPSYMWVDLIGRSLARLSPLVFPIVPLQVGSAHEEGQEETSGDKHSRDPCPENKGKRPST